MFGNSVTTFLLFTLSQVLGITFGGVMIATLFVGGLHYLITGNPITYIPVLVLDITFYYMIISMTVIFSINLVAYYCRIENQRVQF